MFELPGCSGALGLTIVCEDALRGNHLAADVADDKTEFLQSWDVAAAEHVWEKTTSRLASTGRSPSRVNGPRTHWNYNHQKTPQQTNSKESTSH